MQLSDRIRRRIKLQDLHVLMTVVQAGSMGKAARRLNVSQPAISRSITELEHTLEVRLLDRYRHGIEPTEYGRALLDCGVAVFDDLDQGVKNIEFLADPEAGEVRIGYNPFLAATFVCAVIDRLSRQYPRIVFHVVAAEVEALQRELRARNIDLIVAWRFDPGADEQLGFEKLYDDSYAVAAGANNPWARRRTVELADLMNQLWVLPPPDTVVGSLARDAFRASGLDCPRACVSTLQAEVRVHLLATGRFLTIFPASAIRFIARRPDIKALPVRLPMAGGSIGIVTLKNRTLGAVVQLFIDTAREVAKPLARRK